MAEQKPTFMTPNNLDSIGSGSASDGRKGVGPDPAQSGPKPNTHSTQGGDVAGSSPNKSQPTFMGPNS